MTAPRAPLRPGTLATWSALTVVDLVWGSTYLGVRILDRSVPPMIGMGTRFLAAGALLALILAVRHGPGILRVRPRQLAAAVVAGVLLLTIGNGAVAVAERTVPSGVAALLAAAVPLWLVCLRLLAGDRPGRLTVAGTVLGFAGLAALSLPGGHTDGAALPGVAVLMVGTLSWAAGSFLSPRLPLPPHPFVATSYEMLAAGAVLLAGGAATGETRGLHPAALGLTGWAVLAYLTVVGSLVAYSAYVWLLGNAPLSLTATYAYVNPVVAVALGALVLAEPVTPAVLLGGGVVVAGVGLVVSGERPGQRRHATPEKQESLAGTSRAPARP